MGLRGQGDSMRYVLFLLLCATVAGSGYGQEVKAPEKHFDKIEWSLLAADAGVRALDVYSTHWAEKAGNTEGTLPGWIANHPPVMALYSGGIVAGQYFIARKLFKHGHKRLAYTMTALDISVTAPFAIHNLFLPVCTAPNIYTATGCHAPIP